MESKIALTASMLSIVLFISVSFAIPGVPHQFYGDVAINGAPAPDGATISAMIDNSEVASTTSSGGKYGYSSGFFIEDPDNNRAGKTIKFFVNGVDTGTAATFTTGGSTELNLAASISTPGYPYPTPSYPTPLGGGGSDGGGGGGGGPSIATSSNLGILTQDGSILDILLDNTANFILGGDAHYIKLKNVNSTTAVFEIRSTAVTVALTINEIKRIDFDSDGNDDLEVKLNSISGLSAKVTLRALEQSEQPACEEKWSCTSWSSCKDGLQSRTCSDANKCGTDLYKPFESQPCSQADEEQQSTPFSFTAMFTALTGNAAYIIIVGAVAAGILGFLFYRQKAKKGTKKYSFRKK